MDKQFLIAGLIPNSINPSWMAVEPLPDRIGSFVLRNSQSMDKRQGLPTMPAPLCAMTYSVPCPIKFITPLPG